MAQRSSRNNIVAGLFVVCSVGLAVWVAFVLADRGPGAGGVRFTIRFGMDVGAAGLDTGSTVQLGGVPIGRVVGVRFDTTGAGGVPSAINVEVEVRKDLPLYENAGIYLEKPLLGSLSNINIAHAGGPVEGEEHQGASSRIEAGEQVMANLAPPGFLAQAGIGPDQIRQVQGIIASIEKSVNRIEQSVATGSPKLDESLQEARSLVGEARANFQDWSKKVGTTLTNAEIASEKWPPMMEDAQKVVESAQALFEDARSIVRDNRARIEETISSAQSLMEKLDTQSATLLNDALTSARAAMAQAQQAIQDVQGLISQETPNVRKILANVRLTADQLKLTSVEVRSQPWRLLHQPTTKELSQQVLYDATRAYAEAASDVRAASESLSQYALTRNSGGGGDALNSPDLTDLTAQLAKAIENFRKAEQEMLQELVDQPAK
jgi:ABC-type transporter Mla subunit MlaD